MYLFILVVLIVGFALKECQSSIHILAEKIRIKNQSKTIKKTIKNIHQIFLIIIIILLFNMKVKFFI